MNPRHPAMKLIAFVVSFTFFVTNLSITPEAFAALAITPASEVSGFSAGTLAIPAELGQVTDRVTGDPKAPAFIHIQSAHGNYGAEKNIERLLSHIEKNSSVKLLLLEGAASKLKPELFRLFPQHPDFNRKVTDKLMQEGYLTGPERFLIENADHRLQTTDHSKKKGFGLQSAVSSLQSDGEAVQAFGMEDLDAYKKDRAAFIATVKAEKTAEKYIASLRASIDKRFSAKLNKDLLNLVRQEEAFGSGTVSFEGWLKTLGEGSKKHLKTDLSDAFYQDQYPSLIRYYRLLAIGSKIDQDKALVEQAAFIKELEKQKISKEVINVFTYGEPGKAEGVRRTANRNAKTRDAVHRTPYSVQVSGYSPMRAAFDQAFDKLPKNFSMNQWPNWTLYAQHIILMQELEGKGLHEETVRLKDKIQNALAKTAEEKEYLSQARQLYLLRRLFSLELTRAEYEELSLKSEARSTKLETISNEQKPNDKNKDVLNLKHSSFGFVSDFDIRDSKLGELYRSAMSFYQMAIVREEKMFQNALTRMSSQKQQRAVIVTGGFHADGLKKLATSKNCSYIQITPRINEVSKRDHEVYLRSILGSRDVETSQMSALLGIVDRAQRVTVTGIAATKGWARDVRGLILGMINSENVSDRPGLNLAFSSSIFGSATSSLAPVIARAEVRLPTGDETTAFTNLINQFQIVWDNHPTAVTVGIGVLLSLIGIVAVKYIKHTRNVVELRRQNPILDLIMKKAPKISSKKALELVLEAKSVFDAKGDFEVFFHEATKEYQQNVGEPKQEHLSNGGYVEYYDTETIPATPAYWYIAAPSNVRSEVRLTLAQEKQFTQTTAISQQTTAKIAVTAHFSGVAKKLMLAAVVGMMSVSAKAADVVAPAANDVATAEARSQSEVAKGDAFQIAIDNLLKSPDIYGAAIALLQLKDPRTVPALLELLKDKNQRVRGRAINVLAEFRDDPRVADALRSAASDEDGFVKWVATGTPKDIEKPQGAVNSSSGLSARDAALFAMLRDPLKDEDPNMKSKIELYLKEGGVQDPDAADLFRIITAVKPVLNQFNSDPGLSAFFIKVLTDKKESGRVLQTAILILGVLEENGATPALLPYLKDENIKTRMAVVSTLQNLNDRRVIPEAIRVLKEDPVAKIRMQSIGVLRLYSDARVMSALREASLKDPNEDVRKMARYTVKIIEKFQKKQNTAPSAPRSELRVDLVQIASIVFFVITYLLSGHELRQVKAFVNGDESRYGNYREVLAQRLAQSKGIENPTEEQLLAGAVWAAPQAPAFFAFLAGGFGALYLSLTWGEVFLSAALSSIVVHSMVKFGALTLVKNRNSGQGPEDSNISDSDSRSEVRLTAAQEKQFQKAMSDLQPKWWDGMLNSYGHERKFAAVKALGKSKDPRAVLILNEARKEEGMYRLTDEVIDALAELGGPPAISALLEIFEEIFPRGPDPVVSYGGILIVQRPWEWHKEKLRAALQKFQDDPRAAEALKRGESIDIERQMEAFSRQMERERNQIASIVTTDLSGRSESRLTPAQEKQFQKAMSDLQPRWWERVFVGAGAKREAAAFAKVVDLLEIPETKALLFRVVIQKLSDQVNLGKVVWAQVPVLKLLVQADEIIKSGKDFAVVFKPFIPSHNELNISGPHHHVDVDEIAEQLQTISIKPIIRSEARLPANLSAKVLVGEASVVGLTPATGAPVEELVSRLAADARVMAAVEEYLKELKKVQKFIDSTIATIRSGTYAYIDRIPKDLSNPDIAFVEFQWQHEASQTRGNFINTFGFEPEVPRHPETVRGYLERVSDGLAKAIIKTAGTSTLANMGPTKSLKDLLVKPLFENLKDKSVMPSEDNLFQIASSIRRKMSRRRNMARSEVRGNQTPAKASSLRSPATKVSAGRPVSSLLSSVFAAAVMGVMGLATEALGGIMSRIEMPDRVTASVPYNGNYRVESTPSLMPAVWTPGESQYATNAMTLSFPESFEGNSKFFRTQFVEPALPSGWTRLETNPNFAARDSAMNGSTFVHKIMNLLTGADPIPLFMWVYGPSTEGGYRFNHYIDPSGKTLIYDQSLAVSGQDWNISAVDLASGASSNMPHARISSVDFTSEPGFAFLVTKNFTIRKINLNTLEILAMDEPSRFLVAHNGTFTMKQFILEYALVRGYVENKRGWSDGIAPWYSDPANRYRPYWVFSQEFDEYSLGELDTWDIVIGFDRAQLNLDIMKNFARRYLEVIGFAATSAGETWLTNLAATFVTPHEGRTYAEFQDEFTTAKINALVAAGTLAPIEVQLPPPILVGDEVSSVPATKEIENRSEVRSPANLSAEVLVEEASVAGLTPWERAGKVLELAFGKTGEVPEEKKSGFGQAFFVITASLTVLLLGMFIAAVSSERIDVPSLGAQSQEHLPFLIRVLSESPGLFLSVFWGVWIGVPFLGRLIRHAYRTAESIDETSSRSEIRLSDFRTKGDGKADTVRAEVRGNQALAKASRFRSFVASLLSSALLAGVVGLAGCEEGGGDSDSEEPQTENSTPSGSSSSESETPSAEEVAFHAAQSSSSAMNQFILSYIVARSYAEAKEGWSEGVAPYYSGSVNGNRSYQAFISEFSDENLAILASYGVLIRVVAPSGPAEGASRSVLETAIAKRSEVRGDFDPGATKEPGEIKARLNAVLSEMFRWIREKVEDQTFSTWRPEAEVPNREHEYIHGFSAPGYLDPDYEKINKSIDSEYLPRFIALGDLAIPIITELLAIPDDSSNHYLRFSLEYVEFALMKRQVEAGLAAVGISRVVNHPAKQGVEIDHTIKTLVELYKWHRAAWTKLLAYLGKKSQLDRGRQFTGIYVSPSVTFHHIMSSFSGNGAFGAKNFWVVAVPSKIDPQTLDFMPGKVRFSRSEVRNQNTDQRLQTTDQRPTTKDKASSLRSPATKVSAGRPVSSLLSSVLAVVMGMMAVSVRAAENTLAGRIPASGQNKVSSTTIQQISLTQAEVHLLEEVMNEVHPTSFLFGMMDWAKGYFNALGTIKTHRAQGTPVPDRVVTVRTDFPPFVERGVLKSLFKKSMIDAKSSAIEKAVAEKCLMIFGRNFNEPLGIALNDSDYYVRIIAAYILGKQNNDPRAITKLLEMLKQDSPYVDLKSVHAGAAIAIGEIGTRNEVQKLVDIGINEKNPKVGGLVLAAIRKIEKREGLSPVTVDLRENVSPSEVFLDDFDMGWINGLPDETTAHERKFQNALLGLQEKADNVKKEAAETLGRLKDRRGIPVLIWALKEGGGNEVRAAAAKSLGEFGDERAIHPLKKAVESGDESLRQAAKEALEKIQSSFRSEMRVDLILIAFVAFFAITVLLSGHELRHVKALKNRDEGRYGNYRAVLAQRLAQFKGIENPTEEQLLAGAVWAAPQAPAFFAALAGGFGAFYLFLSLGEVALSAALSCFVVYSMVKFGAISIVNQGKSGQGPEDSNLSDTESRSEVRLPLPTGQAGANVAVAGKDGRAEARGQRKWLTAIKAIQGLIVAVVTSRIIWSIHLIAARGQEEALGIDGVGLLGIIMACLFMAIPAGVVLLLPFFAWSGFLDYLFKKFPTRWIPEGFSRDDLRRHLPVLGHLWDSLRLLKWASLRDSAMLLAIENHDTDKLVSLGHPRAIRFMANDEWLEWDASAKDIWNAMALLEKFNAKERDKTKAREIFIKHLTYAAYKNEHIGDLHETAALLKMLKATALQISGAVSLVLSTCSNLLQNDGKNIFEKVLEVKGATPSFLREYFQMYKAGIYDPIVKLGLPPEQTVRDITKALNRTKISVIPAVTREEYEEETGYNQGGPSTVEVTIIPREEKIDLEPAIKEAQRIVAEATGRSEMRTYQTPVISQIPAGDASNLTAKIGTAIRVAANTHRSEVRGNLSAKPSTLFAKRLMLAAVMEMMAISGLVGCVSFRQATRFVPGPTNSAMVQAGSQVSSQRILTRAEEKRFREAIKGLKAERSWDQADAVKALVALKDPRAIPELIKLLDASTDEDYFYHNEVVSAIVKLKDSQTAPKLIEALKDKSGSVRSNAAKALTELKDPRAFLALIEALNDEDYKVRAAAAEALGALKDPKAVPALLVKLKDESWWVRSNAADALGAIKDSRATPGLGEAVKDEKMGVFISAAKALLEIGDFEAISVLLSALKDREYDNLYTGLFRQKALEKIMGFLEDPRAIPLAVEASKDKEDNVRNTAVEVLRQIRKAESERKKQSSPTSVDANEKAEARSETRSPSFRTESDGKVGTVRAEVRLMPEQLHTAATAIFAISSLLTVYFSGSLLWKAVKFRTGKFTASDREIALARSYLAQKGLPFYVGKNIDLLFNVLRYYIETDPRLARGFLPVAVLMYYGMINGPNSIGAVLLGGSVIVAFAYGKFLKWIAAHIASPDDLDVNQYDRPRGRSEETGRRPEGKGKEARSEMRNDEPDLALLGAVIKSMAYGSPEADGLPVQLEELSRSTLLYIFKDRDWVALSVKKGISMADSERDSEGLEPVGDDEANVEQSIRKIRQRFADRLREISRTPKAIREWRFFAEGPGKSGVNLPGLKREVQSLATFTPEIIRESEVFPNLSRETLMAFFLEDKARVRRWISANLLSLEVPGAIYEAEDRRKAVEDRIAAKLVDMSTTTSELMELTELKGEGLYENGELFEKLAKSLPYFTYAQAFLAQDFPGRALAIAKIDEFYQRQDINDQTKAEITARLSEFLKKEDPNLLNLMNSLLKRSQGAFYLRGNPGMPGQKKTVTIEIQTITRAFLELLKGVSDIKVLKALTSALIQLLRYSLLYGPADVKADIKEALIRFDDRAKSERIPLNIYDHMEAGIKAEMRSEVRSNEKPNRKALDWVVYPKRNALETIGIDKSSIGAKIGTAIRVAANTVSPLLSSKPAYASEIAPQVFAGTSHFQKVTVVPPALAAKWPVLSKIIGSSATASTERMVIDQRQGIPDAASLLPLVTFAAYNPKASVVLALIADASDVEAFIKELAALSPKGALPQNFKVKAFANENEFVRAFAGFYNDAAPLGQSVALVTDRENSIVTKKIGSRKKLLSVVGATSPLKQTASTLLAADKLLNEAIWSLGYHFVSVEKLGGLEALMAELTSYVATQAKVLASA